MNSNSVVRLPLDLKVVADRALRRLYQLRHCKNKEESSDDDDDDEEVIAMSPQRKQRVVRRIPCSLCGLRFKLRIQLKKHLASHQRTLKVVKVLPIKSTQDISVQTDSPVSRNVSPVPPQTIPPVIIKSVGAGKYAVSESTRASLLTKYCGPAYKEGSNNGISSPPPVEMDKPSNNTLTVGFLCGHCGAVGVWKMLSSEEEYKAHLALHKRSAEEIQRKIDGPKGVKLIRSISHNQGKYVCTTCQVNSSSSIEGDRKFCNRQAFMAHLRRHHSSTHHRFA